MVVQVQALVVAMGDFAGCLSWHGDALAAQRVPCHVR